MQMGQTSLEVQRLRICPASVAWEDPACCRVTKPGAAAAETPRTPAPQ